MNVIHSRYQLCDALRGECALPPSCWLAPAELGELSCYRHGRRREAWLMGRRLTKRLIRDAAALDVPDAAIEVTSRDAAGRGVRPRLRIDGRSVPWCVSISHSSRVVWAALSTEPAVRVGVDLATFPEVVGAPPGTDQRLVGWSTRDWPSVNGSQSLATSATSTFGRGFLQMWFTEREQMLLRSAAPPELARFWAAKEAAYKALNNGERFVPRRYEIRPSPGAPHEFCCRLENDNVYQKPGLDPKLSLGTRKAGLLRTAAECLITIRDCRGEFAALAVHRPDREN